MKAAEFLEFISEIKQLDHHQRTILTKTLDQLEDEPKVYDLIETIFDSKGICPHCSHAENYRHGIVDGLQRYRCKACKKTFNALTGTPLAHLRLKSKWLDYLGAIARSLTVRQAAKEINVHRNTTFRWRHRFLSWIQQDRPSALHGITEADETYLLESHKGEHNLNRQPRKRGGTATKRGISDEQVCILIARDRSKQTVDFVTGNGPISKAILDTYLKPVLDQDALLVSDGNPTYGAFCKAEKVSHEIINMSQGQRVTKGAYHIQNVNAYHPRFKSWLDRFHGVATKYLPNYLGWCRIMDQNRNLTPEQLLHSALGNFQYLTVT
jgi:transposase-like protein